MKYLYIIITLIILSSCVEKNIKEETELEQIELSKIIDNLLRFRFYDVAVVQLETKPIHKINPFYKGNQDSLSIIPPPPPPTEYAIYGKDFFETLVEEKLLNTTDANYMFNSIDSTYTMRILPSYIDKTYIAKEELDSIFKDDIDNGYLKLKNRYDSSSHISIGTPIFNEDMTSLILTIDYFCGGLCGQGYIFVLTKTEKQWRIIDVTYTWTS